MEREAKVSHSVYVSGYRLALREVLEDIEAEKHGNVCYASKLTAKIKLRLDKA